MRQDRSERRPAACVSVTDKSGESANASRQPVASMCLHFLVVFVLYNGL